MRTLPSGCSARYGEIERIGYELLDQFINGNRSHVLTELMDFEDPKAALAVAAFMQMEAGKVERGIQTDLISFFMESA
jgi:hypothetical protein